MLSSIAIAAFLLTHPNGEGIQSETFAEPIDALSVSISSREDDVSMRYRTNDGAWSDWERMKIEDAEDPQMRESNLVMFPEKIREVEVKSAAMVELHPIRVNGDPVTYRIAGPDPGTPKILSRDDWGADEDLLYTERQITSDDSAPSGDNGDTLPAEGASQRELNCLEAQRKYPAEFKTTGKTVKTVDGKTLLWPQTYSKEVNAIVVHHTAVNVRGDTRSGPERVRALYKYHAVNRGWGDVGYNYLVDEDGQIYEGRAGGDSVVGGHAYCNNIGTIGIALLGNFEIEKPSQDQMKALQWLLDNLAARYDIDVENDVTYRGERMSPIVGHGDLLSTECPGFYVRQTLSQVRSNVEDGDLNASIKFPNKPKPSSRSSSSRSTTRTSRSISSSSSSSARPAFTEGVTALGSDSLGGRPGGEIPFSVRYTTGSDGAKRGERIATVERSDQRIVVWQRIGETYEPVRGHIIAPTTIPRGGVAAIQLKIQLPRDRFDGTLTIGDAVFTVKSSGRVSLPGEAAASVRSTRTTSSSFRSVRPLSSKSSTSKSLASAKRSEAGSESPSIRIRLESRDATLASCDDVDLSALRRLYRGTVTCREIDGKPALINTVGLEDYLLGLSEEPDTEPYEKQRAFAIAARTYAAHYMQDAYRKFPGKPYDGSDSPAIFQKYTGKSFEANNPNWLDAVKDTANLVLTKDDQIIRPAYFSSDDGRTRAPSEIGWGSFPFAEIFTSKDDPWCEGMENRGHGVGMSGCGAEGQANEGKIGEEILKYYYPGTKLQAVSRLLE